MNIFTVSMGNRLTERVEIKTWERDSLHGRVKDKKYDSINHTIYYQTKEFSPARSSFLKEEE